MPPVRVGFLYNHFFAHQVPHSAPIAFELSRRAPQLDIVLLCSSEAEAQVADRIGQKFDGHRCRIERLRVPRARILARRLKPWGGSSPKRVILAHNLERLRGLDALVVPERNSVQLKLSMGLDRLKLIHTRHGAGDREGSFDERLRSFDLVLVPGQKGRRWLVDNGFCEASRVVVTGYPKFDAFGGDPPQRFFDNDRPTVVYNPHFDPALSSWRKMGRQVLDYFVEHPERNLIFAPHVELLRLTRRGGLFDGWIPRRAGRAPNIRVDRGSERSTDMSYSRAADIYLGDASSQIYEFVRWPRPCILLDAHAADWEANPFYRHWQLGDVVDDIAGGLGPALERAQAQHAAKYAAIQHEAVGETFFSEPGRLDSVAGAEAIARFLALKPLTPAR